MTCPVCRKNHFALCHKCPHHADVQAGKYSNREYSKTPCSGCQLSDELSHAGQTFVSVEATEFDKPISTSRSPDVDERFNSFAMFLAEFLRMSRRDQIIVSCRFLHYAGHEKWPYNKIASRLKITFQAVHQAQKKIVRKIPAWKEVFGD